MMELVNRYFECIERIETLDKNVHTISTMDMKKYISINIMAEDKEEIKELFNKRLSKLKTLIVIDKSWGLNYIYEISKPKLAVITKQQDSEMLFIKLISYKVIKKRERR